MNNEQRAEPIEASELEAFPYETPAEALEDFILKVAVIAAPFLIGLVYVICILVLISKGY